jgi:hypothetical protein
MTTDHFYLWFKHILLKKKKEWVGHKLGHKTQHLPSSFTFPDQCCTCVLQYLSQFALSPSYSLEEFQHWFLPRDGIVDSYVVEVSTHCALQFIFPFLT